MPSIAYDKLSDGHLAELPRAGPAGPCNAYVADRSEGPLVKGYIATCSLGTWAAFEVDARPGIGTGVDGGPRWLLLSYG